MSLLEVDDLPALRARLADAGIVPLELDLTGCDSKATLMMRCVACLQPSPGFGHNWDALIDALRERLHGVIAGHGVAAVMVIGAGGRLPPDVAHTLQGVLLDLVAGFDAEACLVYWVVPTGRAGGGA